MTIWVWLLALPLVVVAVCLDIVLNAVICTLIFWEFPRELTISQRLEKLIRRDGWKGYVADWVASVLLDPFDPSGIHIKR
jgi:hypothetical protein